MPAIYRGNASVLPTGETTIRHNDEVFVLAAEEHVRTILRELRRGTEPVKRVMIAGGGHIGLRVARALQNRCQVKVIESDLRRAESISSRLDSVLVLHADATEKEVLEQESIEEVDLFLALTNRDEDNIMCASLAKGLDCQRVVALVNRRAYAELIQGGPINIVISPAQLSISVLLTYVRRGDVAQVHSLRHGAAEALEIVAHGDKNNSKVVGRRIRELPPIPGAFIAAIVRASQNLAAGGSPVVGTPPGTAPVLIAHKDAVIQEGDHAVVFCLNKKVVKEVEKLFLFGFHFA